MNTIERFINTVSIHHDISTAFSYFTDFIKLKHSKSEDYNRSNIDNTLTFISMIYFYAFSVRRP